MDEKNIEAIESLKGSIDRLTAIQTDIFNVDTSNDDMTSLKGRMSDLIKSNESLKESIGFLNAAVNDLSRGLAKR